MTLDQTEGGQELDDADDDGGRVLADGGLLPRRKGTLEDGHRVKDDRVHAAPADKVSFSVLLENSICSSLIFVSYSVQRALVVAS